jgi:ABC-type glycerol-3-phosphate transport system substrate-binding protein
MKKIFGLFLIAGMLVISACGGGAKQDATATDSTKVTETPVADTTMVADTTAAVK